MPPQPENFFESLANVPVHYDRPPVAAYGSNGVSRKFHARQELESTLDALFSEIKGAAPQAFGTTNVILSAGAYVDKPGQHGLGKAFDLDGIHWANRSFIAKGQVEDKVLYLAIQALCHKHCGVVLGFNYNPAHQDHLHLDIGRAVRFRESKSVTYFLQEALNTLFNRSLVVDGEYGTNTDGALRTVRAGLGIGRLTRLDNWATFLGAIATEAFGIAEQQLALVGDIA